MRRENEGRILLLLDRHHHSLSCNREIIRMQNGKIFDLIHFAEGRDCFSLEELREMAEEIPEINRIYRCDISQLVDSLRNSVDPRQLLGNWQLRYIVRIMAQAYVIKTKNYDELFYYSACTDHRLIEIPAKYVLDDPECFCLKNETNSDSAADRQAKRFIISQAKTFGDHKPEFGYTMKEKDIGKICRRIKLSHVLETLKIEEAENKQL